jgi:hypothetical protein
MRKLSDKPRGRNDAGHGGVPEARSDEMNSLGLSRYALSCGVAWALSACGGLRAYRGYDTAGNLFVDGAAYFSS